MTEARDEGRYRALMLLAIALVLGMTTWFSASAVIPQLRAEWDLSTGVASWLTIAVQLGFVAGALLSSILNLSDILAPRRVILLGSLGAAAVNLLLVWAPGPGVGIPLRFATGFFLAGVYPPALKLMSTWFQRGRGTALGILVGAITLGSAAPHLVNGLGGLDWEVVIVTTSLLTVAGGILVVTMIADGPFSFPSAVFDPLKASSVLRDRGVRLACLGYFGHMWELYAMWAWFVVFFSDSLAEHGSSFGPATAAYGTFLVIGIGGLGCWLGGVLGDRWGRTNTTATMMAISGATSIAIGFVFGGPTWLYVAGRFHLGLHGRRRTRPSSRRWSLSSRTRLTWVLRSPFNSRSASP